MKLATEAAVSEKNAAPPPEHRSWAREPVQSRAELAAAGKALRQKSPRKALADWKPAADRPDPIQLIVDSSQGRIQDLLPIRYGRMMQTPFTFYRGAAALMAADLATTPSTRLRVQACGDCHLVNFGGFATPERRLVFDINDFDETLPAPWEWDLERLATSLLIACRNNGFSDAVARDVVLACAFAYRENMAEFADMNALDVWYARIDLEKLLPQIEDQAGRKRVQRELEKTQAHKLAEDFPKLVETVGDQHLIKDHPPLVYHWPDMGNQEFEKKVVEALRRYRKSLQEDRRVLLDHYHLRDIAVKVVGVGSVGTWCGVMLLMGSDSDALFLQVKEARSSVLEPYAGKSVFSHRGQRVVTGQRLMQSASDLFLGWTELDDERHFYLRQLRDMKIKPMVEIFSPSLMAQYAEICAWTLARAHARSGEAAMITGYLGKSDIFDRALVAFTKTYADLNERDHAALLDAVKKGRIKAVEEPKAK
jgi:uncharacterized protein (DUF2252 family)